MRIGIVAGVQAELDALLPGVPRPAESGHLLAHRIDHDGKVLFLLCAGVGKVAATTAATLLHSRHRVELLMVIGTAGKIAPHDADLFAIESSVQADYGAQRPAGLTCYTAGHWPIGPAEVAPFRAAIVAPDLPAIRIATSDLFIECGAYSARVRDTHGATLVDMETAAVAQVAALLGVPWAAIKATTDAADDDGADSFTRNLAAAARAAAQAAERLIATL